MAVVVQSMGSGSLVSAPLGNKPGLITAVDDIATVADWTALLMDALSSCAELVTSDDHSDPSQSIARHALGRLRCRPGSALRNAALSIC
jgi:hypothetical protein